MSDLYEIVPITPEQINCEGCRGTGVKTVFCERMCPVRKCATGKGFLSCGDCPEFPGCGTVGQILQHDEQAKQRLEGRKAQLERRGPGSSGLRAYGGGGVHARR